MKKLALNPDDLRVETFEPEASPFALQGSVAAFQQAHAAAAVLPTYDPHNIRCACSAPADPRDACTPVCFASARCVLTEDPDCAG